MTTPAPSPTASVAPASSSVSTTTTQSTTTAASVSGKVVYMTYFSSSHGFEIKTSTGALKWIYANSYTKWTYNGLTLKLGDYVSANGSWSNSNTLVASSITLSSTATSSTSTTTTTTTVAPTSSTMWHIGSSYVLPATSDGQYQKPTISGSSANFSLIRNYNGTNNYRNQMNPTISGSLVRLTAGTTYDWKFQTVANMSPDVNYSQNLIWQIHDYNAGTSPNTVLGTQNINDGGTVWYFHGGSGTWKGKYTKGATDTWEIQVKISTGSTGTEKLYRNGALVASFTGANYSTSSQGYPWWNFGPYEWDWKSNHSSGQISNLPSLDFVFNYLNFGKI